VGGRQRAFEHESMAAVDFVLQTANRSIGQRSFRAVDQIVIEHLRKPSPEAARPSCMTCVARGFFSSNDPHRGLSSSILPDLNLHTGAYKFEMR
jgi:hypothetical protein